MAVEGASTSPPGRHLVGVAVAGAFAAPILGVITASQCNDPWLAAVALVASGLGFFLFPFLVALPAGGPIRSGQSARYILGKSRLQASARIARAIGAALLLGALPAAANVAAVLVTFALGVAGVAAWGLVDRIFWADRDAPAITLDPKTLTVRGSSGAPRVLRYDELVGIEVDGAIIRLSTEAERHSLYVEGGAARAREIHAAITLAKSRAEQGAVWGIANEALTRAPGMSAREWLDKIDSVVAMTKDAGAYRTVSLDEDELWSTFADEGAEPDARAASARVLSRSSSEEVRKRVATFAKDIAREDVRVRVELAMNDDAETAAAEMEALEAQEMARS